MPVSDEFYPTVELPQTAFVCNADYIAVQAGFVTACRNALSLKQYAEYYVRKGLTCPKGDFNHDGRVKIADVIRLKKHLLNCLDAELFFRQTGDMNDDGKLNAVDLALMKRCLTPQLSL